MLAWARSESGYAAEPVANRIGTKPERVVAWEKGERAPTMRQLEKRGISRKELARRMGIAPSRVASMLNGTNNFTIETLVRAAGAVDARLKQFLVPIEK